LLFLRSLLTVLCASLLALALGISHTASAAKQATDAHHTSALGADDLLLDANPFQIISGEMHPARIPVEYWRHRIQMAKAMGMNTIAMYVFWSYHETKEGVFDFTSGNRDIARFVSISQ